MTNHTPWSNYVFLKTRLIFFLNFPLYLVENCLLILLLHTSRPVFLWGLFRVWDSFFVQIHTTIFLPLRPLTELSRDYVSSPSLSPVLGTHPVSEGMSVYRVPGVGVRVGAGNEDSHEGTSAYPSLRFVFEVVNSTKLKLVFSVNFLCTFPVRTSLEVHCF